MKIILAVIISLLLYSTFASDTEAVVDPLDFPNNKYGIHIIDENDLYDAASLVNSSGGDWGYVTLVIRDDDLNLEKWQKIFALLGNWHLIPILRLATHLSGDTWVKPDAGEADKWSDFLSRLHWPVKNRYLVIFNEPNHAKEWGGELNPAEYARILVSFSEKLKNLSSDFFILPAGLDASAPDGKETINEVNYIKQMVEAVPNIYSYIDGWTSHSYPNPGFIGKPSDTGRGSLQTFRWEMEILISLGQKADFPIFITETGWPHMEGSWYNRYFYDSGKISIFLNEAADTVWNDPKIVAVTPFVLNYQSYPFSNFSWKKEGNNGYFIYYDTYRSFQKTAGTPQLSRAFEKFEGLKIENLNTTDSTDLKSWISWEKITGALHSLFYRVFKL